MAIKRLFISLRILQDYQDKGIVPYTQIADKMLYRLSDLQRLFARELSEINHLREVFSCRLVATQKELQQKLSTFVSELNLRQ